MSLKNTLEIDLIKASTSKIDTIDFENLAFGNVFTDHMLVCDFKEGAWQKPIIKPYEPFLIDPSAKVFHYGKAIFEGMKAYKDDQDAVWLFRPEENFKRFNKSAVRMAMPEVPENIFMDGLKTILDLDRNWVKKGIGEPCPVLSLAHSLFKTKIRPWYEAAPTTNSFAIFWSLVTIEQTKLPLPNLLSAMASVKC